MQVSGSAPFRLPGLPSTFRAVSSEPADRFVASVSDEGPVDPAQLRELFRSDLSAIEVWRAKVPEGSQAPPAVGPDGRVAIVHGSGLSLLRADGTLQKEILQESLQTRGRPAFDSEGRVYVSGDLTPGLRAYSAQGDPLWETSRDEGHYTSKVGPVVSGDRIFFAEATGVLKVFGVDGKLGDSVDTESEFLVAAHLHGLCTDDRGRAWVVGDRGQLRVVEQGRVTWSTPRNDLARAARLGTNVAQRGDSFFYCDRQGHLRKLSADGSTRWRFSHWHKQPIHQLSEDERKVAERLNVDYGFGTTPVFSPDGKTVYVGRRESFGLPEPSLTALSAETGEHRWTVPLGTRDWVGPENVQVDEDGFIYVGDDYGERIQCLSPEGQVQWTFATRSRTGRLGLTLDGDRLIVSTGSGWIHALSRDALQQRVAAARSQEAPVIWVDDEVIQVGDFGVEVRS